MNDGQVHEVVQARYGAIASGQMTSCCGGSADCCGDTSATVQLYEGALLEGLPNDVVNISLGCGDPRLDCLAQTRRDRPRPRQRRRHRLFPSSAAGRRLRLRHWRGHDARNAHEGEFSDAMRTDAAKWAECVTGAIDADVYTGMMRQSGFINILIVDKSSAEGIVERQPGMPRIFSARITAQKPL